MPIPEIEKVIYDNNPLDTVICQARFPSILRIDTESPSAFQEILLPQYINYREGQEFVFDIKFGRRSSALAEDIEQLPTPAVKNYEFASEDNEWKVNLTRNFLSLSTNNYKRWGDFRARFESALNAFVEVYKPVIFTRIGLRYVDVIVRSNFNLEDVDWVELINPNLLGILASPELKESVKSLQTRFVIGLDAHESIVKVTVSTVKSATNPKETCFMIDSDYYELKNMKRDELMAKLDFFHSKALGLFRWCIAEKLHVAMGPNKIQ